MVPVYRRIVEIFEGEQIDTMFGIPDPGFFHILTTAESRGWKVVAPHHEQAGCFMADAWSRMTGKPGICFGTYGPGVANLVAGAIVAAKENSPTIFLAGNRANRTEQNVRRGRIQFLRQPKYFEPIMKYVGIIENPEQTDEVLYEALRVCQSGRPGPVYVEIPSHILLEERNWAPLTGPSAYRLTTMQASANAIDEAVTLIGEARAPVLLVGQGVFTARAQDKVATLARLLDCPIIQTSGGPSFMEGLEERTFSHGFSSAAIEAVESSDLAIAVGTELGEPVHFGLNRHWAKHNADRKWIYIERDPLAFGTNRPINVPMVADLRDAVPQLVNALKNVRIKPSTSLPRWIEDHKQMKRQLADSAPRGMVPMHPARMVTEVTKAFPDNAIMIRDGGATTIFTWTYSQATPHDVLWNQNLGHLGTGLPYAIGASLAAGEGRPVILLTGDSSFMFHISELETAVRKKLPIVCVVSCDYAWGLEVGAYRRMLGPQSAETEAHWGKGTRFDQIARGFGAHGELVEREEDLAPAIVRAIASGLPAVIQVPVDPDAIAMESPNYEEYKSWGAY